MYKPFLESIHNQKKSEGYYSTVHSQTGLNKAHIQSSKEILWMTD